MAHQIDRSDHSSERGARALAGSIEQHWEAKGHRVQIEVVPAARDPKGRTLWSVRSDRRAGLPSRAP